MILGMIVKYSLDLQTTLQLQGHQVGKPMKSSQVINHNHT
jgi:hypothetical protein